MVPESQLNRFIELAMKVTNPTNSLTDSEWGSCLICGSGTDWNTHRDNCALVEIQAIIAELPWKLCQVCDEVAHYPRQGNFKVGNSTFDYTLCATCFGRSERELEKYDGQEKE